MKYNSNKMKSVLNEAQGKYIFVCDFVHMNTSTRPPPRTQLLTHECVCFCLCTCAPRAHGCLYVYVSVSMSAYSACIFISMNVDRFHFHLLLNVNYKLLLFNNIIPLNLPNSVTYIDV